MRPSLTSEDATLRVVSGVMCGESKLIRGMK